MARGALHSGGGAYPNVPRNQVTMPGRRLLLKTAMTVGMATTAKASACACRSTQLVGQLSRRQMPGPGRPQRSSRCPYGPRAATAARRCGSWRRERRTSCLLAERDFGSEDPVPRVEAVHDADELAARRLGPGVGRGDGHGGIGMAVRVAQPQMALGLPAALYPVRGLDGPSRDAEPRRA